MSDILKQSRPVPVPSGRMNRISRMGVFDYMEHDLLGLVAKKIKLSSARVRSIFKQMAAGLSDLHSKNIIHRDIKSKFNSSKCVGGFKGQCKDSRSGFIS